MIVEISFFVFLAIKKHRICSDASIEICFYKLGFIKLPLLKTSPLAAHVLECL